MKLAPRLLITALAAFAVGSAAGAGPGGPVAALQPSTSTTESQGADGTALRAALRSEARHLGTDLRESVAAAIARAEREHGIPALLLVALIAQESSFDPTAENGGAFGLLQLRPFVAEAVARRSGITWHGERTLLDPVRNIQLASRYLGELIDRFESLELALAAYNKGPECVKRQLRAGGDGGPIARFALAVLSRYQHYHVRYAGL